MYDVFMMVNSYNKCGLMISIHADALSIHHDGGDLFNVYGQPCEYRLPGDTSHWVICKHNVVQWS